MRYYAIAASLALTLTACASGGKRSAHCAPLAGDTIYGPNAYRECAVDKAARLLNPNLRIDYRPSIESARGTRCFVAEAEFVINATGVPEPRTIRLLRATPPDFGHAFAMLIPQYRYEPAQKDGQPVGQIAREKHSMATVVTVVPAGQAPGVPPRAPNC